MMNTPLPENEALLQQILSSCEASRLLETKQFMQHGDTNVYDHCVAVARVSCLLADKMGLSVDRESLIRGALLHDYFFYDWHVPDPVHRLHGFTHPKRALQNAMDDFTLTTVEQDMILRHMFPLTPTPPKFREGWVLCLADKVCSTLETAKFTQNSLVRGYYTGEEGLQ
ncbi:metal dependent phosphohydrolase [Methanocorpusculum labreanum Z]|uniref:Metal dependent phosphohydrolase n=1 Tax=Methanocorpusculum labreanum (strain ATCC 43576 / DSM 4855 / Z) TaxID=410358 RepID=A2SPV1_METLZ|nr:HDIG domain-containing metalloprotein [Methanocorpusculum labreanum]ABN06357.1 metal dependent phosphohydrolase [Methanocorpusculum labreanum Z]